MSQPKSTRGKYGSAAVLAATLFRTGRAKSPQEAWEQAVAELFPASPSSRAKCCPKGAFLGLCEDGIIKGIGRGHYTNSRDNKRYAIKAADLLNANCELAGDKSGLWSAVMAGEQKQHNSQMDVVIALWHEGLINHRA